MSVNSAVMSVPHPLRLNILGVFLYLFSFLLISTCAFLLSATLPFFGLSFLIQHSVFNYLPHLKPSSSTQLMNFFQPFCYNILSYDIFRYIVGSYHPCNVETDHNLFHSFSSRFISSSSSSLLES